VDVDLDGFRAWLKSRGLRDATIRVYLGAVRLAYQRKDPTRAVQATKTASRRQQLFSALKLYAKYKGNEKLLEKLAELPRPRSKAAPAKRPLSDQEWQDLLDSVSEEEEPLRYVLQLLVLTGLRVSDILNIERRRVREGLETGTLDLSQKGGSYRPYPVKGDVRTALAALMEWQWQILWNTVTEASHHAAYQATYRALKKCAVAAELDPKRVHPHLMRTTVLVQLYKLTKDILAVKKFAGHKDIRTTQGYLRYVDADELGDLFEELQKDRRR